jgi:hypothetical protein
MLHPLGSKSLVKDSVRLIQACCLCDGGDCKGSGKEPETTTATTTTTTTTVPNYYYYSIIIIIISSSSSRSDARMTVINWENINEASLS